MKNVSDTQDTFPIRQNKKLKESIPFCIKTMAGGGPGSHGSTKQNYDLDQIWGDLREGIEHVSLPFRLQ